MWLRPTDAEKLEILAFIDAELARREAAEKQPRLSDTLRPYRLSIGHPAHFLGVLENLSDIDEVSNVKYVIQRALVMITLCIEDDRELVEAMAIPIV